MNALLRLSTLGLLFINLSAQAAVPMFYQRTDVPKLANASVGRYLYTGDVPRFNAEDMALYVSKMGLTVRVQGWVTPQMVSGYRDYLLARWKKIYDASQDPGFSVSLLHNYQAEEARATDPELKRWLRIAAQYSTHNLENQGVDIYHPIPGDAYKQVILTALLREYMNDSGLEISDGLQMILGAKDGPDSQRLFMRKFKDNFTAAPNDADRPGYLGFLTFVYPIAASTDGPFAQPAEGIHQFAIDGSMEGRWWSNKWQDEFGGLPFLQVTEDGVAFHGPITDHPGDIWFLMRDFVSHSCLRMNVSDVLELRALSPSNLVYSRPGAPAVAGRIPVYIMEWPDVVDWKRNGKPQIMDVAYYPVPYRAYQNDVSPWMGSNARDLFRRNHYQKWDNLLPTHNAYHSFLDTESGLPLYSVMPDANGKPALVKNGYYTEALHFAVFKYNGIRALQYREDGATYTDDFDDVGGKYPPGYFQ